MSVSYHDFLSTPILLNSSPYIEGTHFRMAARNELADLVVSCLEDEAGRLNISEQAYRFVTEENTLSNVLKTGLESPAVATRRMT